MTDPIVDEIRRIRDAHAARFNYDLDAIVRDIQERQKRSGLKFVDGVARRPQLDPEPPADPGTRPDSGATAVETEQATCFKHDDPSQADLARRIA